MEVKSRYVIVCTTPEKFAAAQSALANFSDLKIELNNYDGTSDFIVECTASFATELKSRGLDV